MIVAAYPTDEATVWFASKERGKRRLHAKPNSREVHACRPWLEAELEKLHPQALVLLGATAAQAILGPQFRIQRDRGPFRLVGVDDRYLPTVCSLAGR